MRPDAFTALPLLDIEDPDDEPVEMDFASEAAQQLAVRVLRVEPDVLAFGIGTHLPIVELAYPPPEGDLADFFFGRNRDGEITGVLHFSTRQVTTPATSAIASSTMSAMLMCIP